MSQAKVDRYKKEKKNRAKTIKKKKFKKGLAIVLSAMVVGLAIGFPLGKVLYKYADKQRQEKATIVAESFDAWAASYWKQNYYGILGGNEDTATDTDATSSDASAED